MEDEFKSISLERKSEAFPTLKVGKAVFVKTYSSIGLIQIS